MSDCIIWEKCVGDTGYGKLGINGKSLYAHRYHWEKKNGVIPKGMVVCHSCDNKLCINTDHLFLGTQKDNVHDCISKGRFSFKTTFPKGEKHKIAKLKNKQVVEIKRLLKIGASLASLGRIYGVDPSTISQIKSGRAWKTIGE
jgi:DNA-binding CsgD family transcriptional regulator